MSRAVAGLLAGGMLLASGGCSSTPDEPAPSGVASADAAPALRMTQPRAVHRATLLDDGRVLVTGGCTERGCGGFEAARRAELFDGGGRAEPGPEMSTVRASGTATLLQDGRVLLAGGYPGEGRAPTGSVEVYDPASATFRTVGSLATPRADHSATLLPDGSVLVAGGFDEAGRALSTTELFDPSTDTFVAGPPLLVPRAAHVAVLSGPDLVLLGGTEDRAAIAATEVLPGGSTRWRRGPDLTTPRVKLGAVDLGRGRVFVVGGATKTEGRERLRSSEVVDLVAGTVVPGPDLSTGEYKLDGAVVALADGRVVVGGGSQLEVFSADVTSVERVEVPAYDARSFRTLTAVGPRTVLALGGYDARIAPTDAAYLVAVPG